MPSAALVSSVDAYSPASNAGIEPGCSIVSVEGHPLRDIIDWRWHACDEEVALVFQDLQGELHEVLLEREPGQDWGIEYASALFDPAHQCKNACTFCFMRMLPRGMRDSLYFRDDDYRLSFLQGNFVTFTNLDDASIDRIIEQRISPLRFSLHAVTPKVRASLMGANAPKGLAAAHLLLEQGIELHAQIVLVPGLNDGDELDRTLTWAYRYPNVLNVGIVPLGFTKHQNSFTESFTAPEAAKAVIDQIEPFRCRARDQRGHAWVHVADEFYCNAYGDDTLDMIPQAEEYGDFGMFEDGIGMVRAFADDFASSAEAAQNTARVLRSLSVRCLFVCGRAQEAFFGRLLQETGLANCITPLYVDNEFFGGNVSVTGLLAGVDMARALASVNDSSHEHTFAVVPQVVFNADGVTVDDWSLSDIAKHSLMPVHVVSCQPSGFLSTIADIAHMIGGEGRV